MLDWLEEYFDNYLDKQYEERFNSLQLGDFDNSTDLVTGIQCRMRVECYKRGWIYFNYPFRNTMFAVGVNSTKHSFSISTDISDRDDTAVIVSHCDDNDDDLWLVVSSVALPKTTSAKIFVDKVLSSVVEYLTRFEKDGETRE